MTESSVCTLEPEGSFAWLTLDHPPVNALNTQVVKELNDVLEDLETSSSVKLVLVRSVGDKAFSGGADLQERNHMSEDEAKDFVRDLRNTLTRLSEVPQPTVACIHAAAVGGGLELALACDLRVASENAVVGFPEPSFGSIPAVGGTQRIARLAGPAVAKDLLFTARNAPAAEAKELGVVDRVFPREGFLDSARDFAEEILQQNPEALVLSKRAVNEGLERSLERGLDLEWECYLETFDLGDRDEYVKQFR